MLIWRGARAAESGSLLRSCAPQGHRGFESPPLRRVFRVPEKAAVVFFLTVCCFRLMERGGFEPSPRRPTGGKGGTTPPKGDESGFYRGHEVRGKNRIPPLRRVFRVPEKAAVVFWIWGFATSFGGQVLLHEVIAQLDRASDCGSEGRRFESS